MKIIDCITFFDNNFMFDFRYNILKNVVDFFIVCESRYDHKGNKKKLNFTQDKNFDQAKIKYFILEKPFPKNTLRPVIKGIKIASFPKGRMKTSSVSEFLLIKLYMSSSDN